MTGGELRELARDLRAQDFEWCWTGNSDLRGICEEAAAVLERLADEQEAAPRPYHSFLDDDDLAVMAMQDAEDAAQGAPSEPEHRREAGHLPGGSPVSHSGSGSLGAEADAALIRHTLESAFGDWEAALAALDRLLAGKAAG